MSDPIYYQTDPNTGEYRHPVQVDPDPRNSGRFLVPRGAVATSPPALGSGEVAVWVNKAWTVLEDHRGESGWVDGEPVQITELGPFPKSWSTEAPEPVIPLRDRSRAAMAAYWADDELVPPRIQGSYEKDFQAAVALLTAGKDQAAIWMIEDAVPHPSWDPVEDADLITKFHAIKTDLKTAIENLPPVPTGEETEQG